jgi:hypothetical protein
LNLDENDDYLPPPPSRYFQPTVDTGRMLLRPIPSIEEVSERGSGDFEKLALKKTTDSTKGSPTNPFGDNNTLEKETAPADKTSPITTQGAVPVPVPTYPGRRHYRSRSSGSIREQRPPMARENAGYTAQSPIERDQAMRMGRMNSNRQVSPRQDFYGYPPYPRSGSVDPMRMHSVQRRRSNSVGGGDRRYPRNPVLDGPAWRQLGPPPMRRPSLGYGTAHFPVNQPGSLARNPSAASIRERPSPEHWKRPDTSHPLGVQTSWNNTGGQDPASRSPDNSFSNAWGSVSHYVQGDRPGSRAQGDAARNF